jgi:hypothetical protein
MFNLSFLNRTAKSFMVNGVKVTESPGGFRIATKDIFESERIYNYLVKEGYIKNNNAENDNVPAE